ncbi:cullin like protein [Babesia gibsoni]|uniref:Cullin like protein n=1 Tax=Babesia gibsoni TaxID=33632 RepID=A0AAD8PFL1_BABGI|nr:cullin like protein [Babesia gibsoni]
MKLHRARPVPNVSVRMPTEDRYEAENELDSDIYKLIRFTEAVILGKGAINQCKVLLQEYIREAVFRNRTAELTEKLDVCLHDTIKALLNDIDVVDEGNCQQPQDADVRNNLLLCKVERSWCHLRAALGELIQLCAPIESASCGGFSIWVTAMRYYKEQLDSKDRLYDRLMTVMLDKVTNYRDGDEVIFCQLRNMVEMLSFVESYHIFEERLVSETRSYYRQFVANVLSQNSVFENCLLFQNKIKHEEECCRIFLLRPTIQKVMDTLKIQMLQLNSDVLMNEKDLKTMVKNGDGKCISVLLALYANTNWESKLHDAIFAATKSIGDDLVNDFINKKMSSANPLTPADYDHFIVRLQEFKDIMDTTVKSQLPPSVDYKSKEQMIWNKILNSSPETADLVTYALASYADSEPHEEDMDTSLAEGGSMAFIMHLFRWLLSKPYFEESFRGLLSKRLLYSQEINDEHIRIVANLKEECGTSYVAKLEAILADYQNSLKYNTDYKEYKNEDKHIGGVDGAHFAVLVVSTDSWLTKAHVARPATDDAFTDCDVDGTQVDGGAVETKIDGSTAAMQQMQKGFSELYTSNYKNRSIRYLPDFGSSVLEMEFKGETYELRVSICQAYCLLAFNTAESLSLESIAQIMGTEYNEIILRKHLAFLNKGHAPLLLFKHAGLTFENCALKDKFELNADFTCPERICDLQYRELTFEKANGALQRGMEVEDIMPSVEATIVKHMKQKLEESATAVFKLCHEKFSSIDRFAFNRIVDSLVDRDFLSLDTKNNVLRYVP